MKGSDVHAFSLGILRSENARTPIEIRVAGPGARSDAASAARSIRGIANARGISNAT